jgi:hypothetical protein
MRIPPSAAPDVQESLRSLWAAVDQLGGRDQTVLDYHGKSVANIGDGISYGDAATRRQVDAAKRSGAGSGSLGDTVRNLTVKVLLRVLGTLMVPGLDDAGIVYVKSNGELATDPDAFSFRYTNGALRLGDGGAVRFHHLVWLKAGGVANVSSVFIIEGEDDDATAPLDRVAFGLDDASHPALHRNGTGLDLVQGGGSTTRTAFRCGSVQTNDTKIIGTDATLDNGAASHTGTLTNAPSAGDPAKWFKVTDATGTYWLPAWT